MNLRLLANLGRAPAVCLIVTLGASAKEPPAPQPARLWARRRRRVF
jgi:hypothetical protein